MHLVKFLVNGQRADVAQSTSDAAQSAGAGRGYECGQRVELGADVVLT